MNLKEIIAAINSDVDDTIDNGTLLKWINRALDIASNVAKYEKRITLVFEEGVSDYELPSDLLELAYVFVSGGKLEELTLDDYEGTGYKMWGNTIGFQRVESPSVDLYYFASYPHLSLSDMEGVPKLPATFHDLLVLFSISRLKYQEEEEDRFISGMIGEFGGRLEAFRLYAEKKHRPKRVTEKTIW